MKCFLFQWNEDADNQHIFDIIRSRCRCERCRCERKRDKQTDIQEYRQKDRQTDRLTDRQIDKNIPFADGYLWVTGRIDDMMNCSGHLMTFRQKDRHIDKTFPLQMDICG